MIRRCRPRLKQPAKICLDSVKFFHDQIEVTHGCAPLKTLYHGCLFFVCFHRSGVGCYLKSVCIANSRQSPFLKRKTLNLIMVARFLLSDNDADAWSITLIWQAFIRSRITRIPPYRKSSIHRCEILVLLIGEQMPVALCHFFCVMADP
jgi:hypothetical protein